MGAAPTILCIGGDDPLLTCASAELGSEPEYEEIAGERILGATF
jgi:hypothetical protein